MIITLGVELILLIISNYSRNKCSLVEIQIILRITSQFDCLMGYSLYVQLKRKGRYCLKGSEEIKVVIN